MRDGKLRRIATLEARIAPERPRNVALIAKGNPHPPVADLVVVLRGVKPPPRHDDP